MDSEKNIVQEGEKVLRDIAQPVPITDITSPKIQKILKKMSTILGETYDGVALAAPQIDVPLRIFVVSSKILPRKKGEPKKDLVFINPVIKKTSDKKITFEEGCLSVRWIYGKIKRAEGVTVEAYNEKGFKFIKSGKGLLAQVFQHESDHLDGKLFIDRAFDLYESKPITERGH